MPVRLELTLTTYNLRKGDVVKSWPGGNTNLLGARVSGTDYGDVWHTIRFEDHQLPKTKRWKGNWEWTIWREELTEIEQAEKELENIEKRLTRGCESSRQKMTWAHEKIVKRGPLESNYITGDVQALMDAAAEWKVWEEIVILWENRNKRRAEGHQPVMEDPFPKAEWTIGHAAWYWCSRERKRMLDNRMEIRQSWSSPLEQHWRNLQTHAAYEACTNQFHSVWRYAFDWKEAWDKICKAEEEKYASEGHTPGGAAEARGGDAEDF